MLSDNASLGHRAVRRLARRAPGGPEPHLRLPAGRDPRGAVQRRHPGRDLDLDLHRGGEPVRRPARGRGRADARRSRSADWSSTWSRRGSCTGTRRDSLNVSAALRHVLADLLGSVGVIVAAVIILIDRLGVRRPGGQRPDRAADPGELVGDPARLDPDPARGLADRDRRRGGRARDGLAAGRAPGPRPARVDDHLRAFRPSPPTCWSIATPTATPTRRALERMLDERFGLEHTTLQVDHEGGELLQIETGSR